MKYLLVPIFKVAAILLAAMVLLGASTYCSARYVMGAIWNLKLPDKESFWAIDNDNVWDINGKPMWKHKIDFKKGIKWIVSTKY